MLTQASADFCRAIGIDHPIVQAPMAGGPTSPELVAAVSNAGALGCIAGGYLTPQAFQEIIQKVKSQTQNPFCVNLFAKSQDPYKPIGPAAKQALIDLSKELQINPPDFDATPTDNLDQLLEVVLQEKPPLVSTTFGLLEPHWAEKIQAYGGRLIGTATTVAEARAIEKAGCFAVVAQGFEAGGHRGAFLKPEQPVGLFSLVPQIVDAVQIPVIASGGIMDGRAIVAALALGSVAVQMGTAFLTTTESAAPPAYKAALQTAKDTDTVLTKAFSGKYARGIANRFTTLMQPLEAELASYPAQNSLTTAIRAHAKKTGTPNLMSLWSGQSPSQTRSLPAASLIAELLKEIEQTNLQYESKLKAAT